MLTVVLIPEMLSSYSPPLPTKILSVFQGPPHVKGPPFMINPHPSTLGWSSLGTDHILPQSTIKRRLVLSFF